MGCVCQSDSYQRRRTSRINILRESLQGIGVCDFEAGGASLTSVGHWLELLDMN